MNPHASIKIMFLSNLQQWNVSCFSPWGFMSTRPTHEWLDMSQSDIVNEVVQIRPPDL